MLENERGAMEPSFMAAAAAMGAMWGHLGEGVSRAGASALHALGSAASSLANSIMNMGKKSKSSKKARATDKPSWAPAEKPIPSADGKTNAGEVMDEKYGSRWRQNPQRQREYSQLEKYYDRSKR
jgi:hypothetical protein